MIQSGGLLGRLLGPLLKTELPLIKMWLNHLAKSGLVAASAADAGIHKRIFGSGTTALIISNDEMEDTMKIVKSLDYH